MPADFYDLLDVGPDASAEEIRGAYREKAREYHPDVNPDARSSDQFKAIRTAYEVLSDAGERKDYDRVGHEAYVDQRLDGLPGGAGGRPSGSSSGRSDRQTVGDRGRQSATTSGRSTGPRSSGRGRSTARGADGPSKPRSTWGERTISEPGARARAMRAGERIGVGPLLAVAAAGYLAGLAIFLAASTTALATIADALSTGDVDAFLATLQTPGFANPFAFVGPAIEQPSPTLLFPVGTVAFPLALAIQAIRADRPVWWVPAVLSAGPLVGMGLATDPFVSTVAVDLALYVLLPALALIGATTTFLRR